MHIMDKSCPKWTSGHQNPRLLKQKNWHKIDGNVLPSNIIPLFTKSCAVFMLFRWYTQSFILLSIHYTSSSVLLPPFYNLLHINTSNYYLILCGILQAIDRECVAKEILFSVAALLNETFDAIKEEINLKMIQLETNSSKSMHFYIVLSPFVNSKTWCPAPITGQRKPTTELTVDNNW